MIAAPWREKYRPKSISDYVFCDSSQETQIKAWIEQGSFPDLLLFGPPGTGKTTLAKILCAELEVDPGDIKVINGSTKEGNIAYIQEAVGGFIQTIGFGPFKVVLIEEGDYLSLAAQAALRVPTDAQVPGVRFIITCNYPHKIIPALMSRFQSLEIKQLNYDDFTVNIASILIKENIEVDIDTLDHFVKMSYPDMRKCINNIEQHSRTGVLLKPVITGPSSEDYRFKAIELFKQRKFTEARILICNQASQEEFDSLFTFAYQNLELWCGDDIIKKEKAILAIRDSMAKAPLCADLEINISALFCELHLIEQGN